MVMMRIHFNLNTRSTEYIWQAFYMSNIFWQIWTMTIMRLRNVPTSGCDLRVKMRHIYYTHPSLHCNSQNKTQLSRERYKVTGKLWWYNHFEHSRRKHDSYWRDWYSQLQCSFVVFCDVYLLESFAAMRIYGVESLLATALSYWYMQNYRSLFIGKYPR